MESAGSVTLTIARLAGSNGPITVSWSTQDATALAGADYVSDSGDLAMVDGQTSGQVTIVLLDDNQVESQEFLNPLITGTTGGASLGSATILKVNLLDDEENLFADGFE